MISYMGGKSKIGKWIVPQIPTDIETYVEGFSGMFWVYFNMDLSKYPKLKTIVYNDFNRLNVNLMKCAKDYDVLYNHLKKYPHQQFGVVDTPKEFYQMFNQFQKEVFDKNLVIDDRNSMEIASKYVYVLTQIFSGSTPEKAPFNDYKGKYKCKFDTFMNKLKNPKYRLLFDKITHVENMDFSDVITKYDSSSSYFYMDPPYWKTENYYSNHNFGVNDHSRLSDSIKLMKGRFGLSYYYFDMLDIWFPKNQYFWNEKQFTKIANRKKDGSYNKGTELFITNYDVPKHLSYSFFDWTP